MAGANVDTLMKFGEYLCYLRRRARMTQRDLGQAIGYSDVQIARLEKGKRTPDPRQVKTLYVEALGLQHEPELAARLVELAVVARNDTRGEAQPMPSTPPRRPGNLPVKLTRFVGREGEITQVTRLVGEQRLVTLTGAGGTGKTRLAIEVARLLRHDTGVRIATGVAATGVGATGVAVTVTDTAGGLSSPPLPPPAFVDGVWLVELASLADPGLVADAVLAALGAAPPTGPAAAGSAAEKLVDALRGRTVLLILDNCEHLIGACAELVESLLQSCPEVRMLATSREALGVPGELVWRVPAMESDEAARLFVDRARVARPGFAMTEYNARVVGEICARLDGIPLALELAAAWVRVLSVEQIAERLGDCFRLLTHGARTALPRQQTLKATFDWSYALLWPEERALFQRLSVFSGGWTLAAAEAVCADVPAPLSLSGGPDPEHVEGRPELGSRSRAEGKAEELRQSPPHPRPPSPTHQEDVLGLLINLVDKSLVLVTADPRDGSVRYRLLEIVRQYAAERLREASQTDVLRERHLAYFVAFAERADAEMHRTRVQAWKARLQTETGNLSAALAWCRANSTEPAHAGAALRVAVALSLFWKWTGYGHEVVQWLNWLWDGDALRRVTLQAAGHPTTLQALALYYVWALPSHAGLCRQLRDLAQLAAECLSLCRAAGDRQGEGYCLLAQRTLAIHDQNYPSAVALTLECLSVFDELRDVRGIWVNLWSLTLTPVVTEHNAYAALVILLERYIQRLQEWGDRFYVADLLYFLAYVMIWLGERERAATLSQQAITLAEEWDNPNSAWLALNSLDVAQPPRALALAEQYLVHQRQAGNEEGIAVALHQLGEILIDNGQYGRAREVLDECVARLLTLGPVQTWIPPAQAINSRAIAARFLGDYRQALADFDESLRLSKESGNLWLVAFVLFHRGLAWLGLGDVDKAATDFQASLKLFHETGTGRDYHPLLYAALSEVMWARQQPQPAMRLAGAAAAFEDEERLNNVNALVDYKRTIAASRARLDDPALAAAWAEGQAMSWDEAVAYALAVDGK